MTVHATRIAITSEERRARVDRLKAHAAAEGLSGVVLFDPCYILYYSGFAFMPTERPMAWLMNRSGRTAFFVPRLELEHAQGLAEADDVLHYPEYPDQTHPLTLLGQHLTKMGISGKIGADDDGYPWVFGYRGPRLSEVTGATVVPVRPFIEDQMAIKSLAEVALLRESVHWAHLAHTLLHRYTVVGASETDVSLRATTEATRAMLDAIGPIYRGQSTFESGASASYRGQIGRGAAIPHALATDIRFQAGDVLVTGASAPLWGYYSELERTMVLGPASEQQRKFFGHMLAMQDTAFEAIRPGRPTSEVDLAVRAYVERNALQPYAKHHTGHALGLRIHEGPFFDSGDHTEIKPGMVFTVEPGLYVEGLGGFRHSDTVLVVDDGIEVLTYYPRDLESLTLPI